MKSHFRAMQVSRPGNLELVERPVPVPGEEEVLLRVEVCGVCGADARDIESGSPSSVIPRIPGHEVVGRIVAMGARVPSIWKIGQRVGVGRLGGHCNECPQCRRGQFQLCQKQPVVGATCDGGYAEMMLARCTGLVLIPGELASEEAAPLLCAGIATFNALRKCGAEPGDTIAVLGIGGLGHMALQYAHRMGFRVVAIGRGVDIAGDAKKLGAHVYVDSKQEDAAEKLKALGGAQAIVTTIAQADAIASVLTGLAPQGRLVLLGAGADPLPVPTGYFVGGERSVVGSMTGSPFESEKALNFSVLTDIRPMIEVMPLEKANEAYQRMRSGDVKFRMVLTMER